MGYRRLHLDGMLGELAIWRVRVGLSGIQEVAPGRHVRGAGDMEG